jgi:hypothetical protein
MPSRKKVKAVKAAVPFSAAEVANIAKQNPYIQRLIEDATLRDNVRTAVDSARSAIDRLSNGKPPSKALLEDKKLAEDLQRAATAVRDVTTALTEAPKRRAKRGLKIGRGLLILGVGGGLALVASEDLRSKVLDTLFGAEEEFEYSPPPAPATPPASSPVSAA